MRWLLKGKFKLFREQRGFTLLEVLVAVGILGLIGVGLLNALDTNARATRTLDEQVTAVNLATAYLEAIKTMSYAVDYPDAEDLITIPSQYSVDKDIDFSSTSNITDNITYIIWVDTPTANETLQRITVTVSREGDKPVLSMCAFKTKRVED